MGLLGSIEGSRMVLDPMKVRSFVPRVPWSAFDAQFARHCDLKPKSICIYLKSRRLSDFCSTCPGLVI